MQCNIYNWYFDYDLENPLESFHMFRRKKRHAIFFFLICPGKINRRGEEEKNLGM